MQSAAIVPAGTPPEGPVAAYDPFSEGVLEDPYPWYGWLRAQAPCHYLPGRELFVVSRHADVLALSRDVKRFSSAQGIFYGDGNATNVGLPTTDPPDHGRLRRLVSRSFAPKAIVALEGWLKTFIEKLLDRVLEERSVDWVDAVAVPLPTTAIAEMLGIPDTDRAEFQRWSQGIMDTLDGSLAPAEHQAAVALQLQCRDYLRDVIEERARRPDQRRADVITTLLDARDDGQLSPPEVLRFCMVLLVAGNETTTGAISNGLLALLRNPDEQRRLGRDPSLLSSTVEEVLRYDAPIQGFTRVALADAEVVPGVVIPAGARVLLLYGSANRDGRVFEDGDQFRVARNPKGALAFGRDHTRVLGRCSPAWSCGCLARRCSVASGTSCRMSDRPHAISVHPQHALAASQGLPQVTHANTRAIEPRAAGGCPSGHSSPYGR